MADLFESLRDVLFVLLEPRLENAGQLLVIISNVDLLLGFLEDFLESLDVGDCSQLLLFPQSCLITVHLHSTFEAFPVFDLVLQLLEILLNIFTISLPFARFSLGLSQHFCVEDFFLVGQVRV